MTDTAELFIDSKCELGEGIFWHPQLERLFWFDILNRTLHSATANGIMVDRFAFDAIVTAAGIIDAQNLAIASAEGIYKLHLPTDTRKLLVALEPRTANTRSNDGRVNRAGGFWIGTMSLTSPDKVKAGSLYQVRGGQVTTLLSNLHIPNATCFSPDGRTAYFADTTVGVVNKVATDPDTGLPVGPWEEFIGKDHPGEPDGAVVDAEGFVWNVRWRGNCMMRFAPDGSVDRVIEVPVLQPTCPAFGGTDLKTLYISSARENMTAAQLAQYPQSGGVFRIEVDVPGQAEALFSV